MGLVGYQVIKKTKYITGQAWEWAVSVSGELFY